MRTAGRILVVDDIADNRRLLSVLFKRRGFDVIEAENGRDALSLIACDDFDLALLDISMPDMDGIELLKKHQVTPLSRALARHHGNGTNRD